MSKALAFVSRYGPLLAALLVGLGGLIATFAPGATPFVDGFVAFLGFFGAAPDAAVATEVSGIVGSALLVYGGVRKLFNIVKEKLNGAPPVV